MSYIVASKAVKTLVNKIKFREERIAEYYREIHDMVTELEEFMGNATELIYKNKRILKRNENSEILPIRFDIFSKAVTYCYHEIIDKQLQKIEQNNQRLKELEKEIEENIKTNAAIRHNKQTLESDIQSIEKQNTNNKITPKQENYITKLRFYLIFFIVFAISLVVALLLTATLREAFVVLLFSGLTGVSFGWWIYLFYTHQSLEQLKDEITEKEFLLNKSIQNLEKQKQQIEQEKQQLRDHNAANIKAVNDKLQLARQQKAEFKIQISIFQDKLSKYRGFIQKLNQEISSLKEVNSRLQNDDSQAVELKNKVETLEKEIQEKQIAIDSFKEQIEAGEHAKRKADNLELDYKRLFEKYHNRESEIQTLQSDLNNSTNENNRLSSKIAPLLAEIEKIQKEKQELESKFQKLRSNCASLENQNKDFQRQREDSQSNYSELEIEYNRIQTENQELERKNQILISQEIYLKSKNEELQTQNTSFQAKIFDLEKEIKQIREEKQGKENEYTGLSSQISSLKAKHEELQAQNNSFQTKISDLEKEIKFLKKENQKRENKYQVSNSQNISLTTKNEELEKQILNYRYEVIQLNIANQDLMKECESLRNEKLNNYNSNKKDYLDLQTKFNALQKENGELRYNLLKLDSKKAQEIIRRNSSDDELDNSSQSVPAEIESITPTEDNRANSEQDLLYKIADEIIKKDSYSEEELIALYRRFNMSIFSGIDKINSWTDDVFGDVLIFEENKRFVIDPEIAAKVRNREVEK